MSGGCHEKVKWVRISVVRGECNGFLLWFEHYLCFSLNITPLAFQISEPNAMTLEVGAPVSEL